MNRDWIAAVVLGLMAFLAFAPFIVGDRSLLESESVAASLYLSGSRNPGLDPGINRVLDAGAPAWQTEPWFAIEHNIIASEHVVPVWNPYSGFGLPLAANMQSQIFFPPTWVAITWDNARGYALWIALRFFIAGILTYVFLRRFFAVVSSFFGAFAYMTTGYLLLYVTMPEQSVTVVIPGLLLAVDYSISKPSFRSAAALAVAIAAIIFGGMPELAILAFICALGFFIVRFAHEHAGIETAAFALGGVLLGAGLGAVQAFPFLQYVSISTNTHSEADPMKAAAFAFDTFDFSMLATYVSPLINGPPANNIFAGFSNFSGARGFFGAAVAVFAIIGLVSCVREKLAGRETAFPALFFGFFAGAALLKRFGSPFLEWIAYLPVLRQVGFLKYEEAILGLCVSLLAAFGLESLRDKRADLFDCQIAVGIVLAVLSAVAFEDRAAVAALIDHRSFYFGSLIGSLGTLLCILATFVALKYEVLERRTAALACVVVAVLNFTIGYFIPIFYVLSRGGPQAESPYNGAPYITALQGEMQGDSRVFAEDGNLYPSWSGVFGLYDVRALDALYDDRYLRFVQAFLNVAEGRELLDRFTGPFAYDFPTALSHRFLALSSVKAVAVTHPLAGILESVYDSHKDPSDRTAKFRTGFFVVGGVAKPGLFMHPPDPGVSTPVVVPAGARFLEFSLGMLDDVERPPICGDGVTFDIELRDATGHVVSALTRYVDPKHIVSERHWASHRIAIPPALHRASLFLRTLVGPSGGTCMDWAAWGDVHFVDAGGKRIVLPTEFVEDYSDPVIAVYRVPGALPRLMVLGSASSVKGGDEALAAITAKDFDPASSAVIESPNDESQKGLPGTATIDAYLSTYVRGHVYARNPSIVMLNDTYYPGWRAFVDGKRAPILRTDFLFRGVRVPSGKHVVEFRYDSRTYVLSAAVSVASLLTCVVLFFFRRPKYFDRT